MNGISRQSDGYLLSVNTSVYSIDAICVPVRKQIARRVPGILGQKRNHQETSALPSHRLRDMVHKGWVSDALLLQESTQPPTTY